MRFCGERFRDHALDLSAITELRQFQEIVAETAKALWRSAHPDRERLPAHFEERTRLCLRRIEDGSATAPLEVYIEPDEQCEFWDSEPIELNEAIALTYRVLESVGAGREIPEEFPRRLIPTIADWGRTLREGDEIELQTTGDVLPVRVNQALRKRLTSYVERPQSTVVELTGECVEADIRHGRFQIWIDPQTSVQATFDATQEDLVTSALKEHHSVRIRVRGAADFSPDGKASRFTNIESMELVAVEDEPFDLASPGIEEELSAIWADVPATEWARLPVDLTDNLDEYLYGAAE
ncbi:MAG TPA: hypothetical protein DD670_08130 [Planctomycetaceae bacterium]|nr:hypothetical protein [Planctomycetaceae bacterium]